MIATPLKGCIDFISIFRNTFEHNFNGKHSEQTIAFITVISGVNDLFRVKWLLKRVIITMITKWLF